MPNTDRTLTIVYVKPGKNFITITDFDVPLFSGTINLNIGDATSKHDSMRLEITN